MQEICKKTNLSKRTVHFYIKEKLITPTVNPENGYFIFSEEDCQRLQLIHEFRNAGLSISVIRSLLNKPVTAGYYLNIHVRELTRQKLQLEQTIDSLTQLLDQMPVHLDFPTLYQLTLNASIPDSSSLQDVMEYDKYDNSLVNLFLWSGFLPTEKFTDYQEFLWEKLNKKTNKSPSPDYKSLYYFLRSQDQKTIDSIFMASTEYYEEVAALTPKTISAYENELYNKIIHFSQDPHLIHIWKKNYHDFFAANTRIFASELGDIVAEISPLFLAYRTNINQICETIYKCLLTEGAHYYSKLQEELGDSLDLENYNHGQIAAIASLERLHVLS